MNDSRHTESPGPRGESTPSTPDSEDYAAYLIVGAVLTVAMLVPLWIVAHPALQDLPYHLARARVFMLALGPDTGMPDNFVVSLFPRPYVIADALVIVFSQFVDILTAGKLVLSIYVVLLVPATAYFLRSFDRSAGILAFFGFLVIHNWLFAMGFMGFSLSQPIALFCLGYWRRHASEASWRTAVYGGILISTVYLTHLFTYAFLVALLIVMVAVERMPLRSWIVLGAALLPTLLLSLESIVLDSGELVLNGHFAGWWMYPWSKLLHAFGPGLPYLTPFGQSPSRLVATIAIAIGLVVLALQIKRRRYPSPTAIALTITLLVIYLLLPDALIVPDFRFVANRVFPLVFLVSLSMLSPPTSRWGRCAVVSTVVVLALAQSAFMVRANLKAEPGIRDMAAAFDSIPEGKRVAAISESAIATRGRVDPFALFAGYYFADRANGVIPDLEDFVGPERTVHYTRPPVDLRSLPERLSERCSERDDAFVILGGSHGQPPTRDFEGAGCRLETEIGPVRVFGRGNSVERHHEPYVRRGFRSNFDYLVLYAREVPDELDPSDICLKPVFAQGYARVFPRTCPPD